MRRWRSTCLASRARPPAVSSVSARAAEIVVGESGSRTRADAPAEAGWPAVSAQLPSRSATTWPRCRPARTDRGVGGRQRARCPRPRLVARGEQRTVRARQHHARREAGLSHGADDRARDVDLRRQRHVGALRLRRDVADRYAPAPSAERNDVVKPAGPARRRVTPRRARREQQPRDPRREFCTRISGL